MRHLGKFTDMLSIHGVGVKVYLIYFVFHKKTDNILQAFETLMKGNTCIFELILYFNISYNKNSKEIAKTVNLLDPILFTQKMN